MPHIAIEVIKVKLDNTGKEVVYEPNTDMTTVGVGTLIETAHILDTDTGIETEVEAGTYTSVTPPVTIPQVSSSIIANGAATDIVVTWSEAIQGTGNIKNALNVVIAAAPAVHPSSVSFGGNKMTMVLPAAATAGQVITWSYDDQNVTELLESAVGNVEADNQTYAVTNSVT